MIDKYTNKEIASRWRDKVENLQDLLLNSKDKEALVTEQDSSLFPLKHTFGDGTYIRQMSMNKGSWCIGKIHKQNHVWFLLTGMITVVTDKGAIDHIAPCYTKSPSGAKRIIYAHEDSIFVTIHENPNNYRDVETLEDYIVVETYKEYEEYINKK
tara:strand:- start:1178 stop:1642 length:465 start_codon:yes stop_codon:yes gene_type:complete